MSTRTFKRDGTYTEVLPGNNGVAVRITHKRTPAELSRRFPQEYAEFLATADAADRAWIAETLDAFEREGAAALQALDVHRARLLLALALRGRKFRSSGAGKGRLRKLIERHWRKIAPMSAREAWEYLELLPAKQRGGIEFYADHVWIETDGKSVGFSRFSNILTDVRNGR